MHYHITQLEGHFIEGIKELNTIGIQYLNGFWLTCWHVWLEGWYLADSSIKNCAFGLKNRFLRMFYVFYCIFTVYYNVKIILLMAFFRLLKLTLTMTEKSFIKSQNMRLFAVFHLSSSKLVVFNSTNKLSPFTAYTSKLDGLNQLRQ